MVRRLLSCLLSASMLSACSGEPQRRPMRDGGPTEAGAIDGGVPAKDAETDARPRDPSRCADAGCFGPIDTRNSVVDLLFVVDNSGSMLAEQAALRREFPRLIQKLITGDHDGDARPDHAAVSDVHIGVVSSNMGADNRTRGCEGQGDDGVFQHRGNLAGDTSLNCAASYPTFLAYSNGKPAIDQVARDFGCIASLGTAGCGFEQHLEAALKAVWPADDPRLSFAASTDPTLTPGHGNDENLGFVRTLAAGRDSTLAIVVVADEDDCSAADTQIFNQDPVDAGNPYGDKPVNLRCHYNQKALLPLERYLFGYRNVGAARVVFAGIVGVPVDLVDTATRAKVDFSDVQARNAYYDKILADPRMQEQVDPASDRGFGLGPEKLLPACSSSLGTADPARRFVELAKRFGEGALIQSLCGDFGPPLDKVVDQIVGPD